MAVKEFRFTGLNGSGQPVQGTVFANSSKTARKRVDALGERHGFRPQQMEQRQTWMYKVRHVNGRLIKGEQKAFSEEELRTALAKMGLEVIKIQKKLFDFQTKPPQQDLIMFVRLSANLLKEKLPFDEVLNLLVNDVSSNSLKQVVRDLNGDLKGGMEAQQAFMKQQHMLGKFTAYMLGIASQTGNMSEIYEATARFLERQNEFKKSVKSAMITPAITLIVLIAAFVWYIWVIFPETAGLFESFNMDLPPMTTSTLAFSKWMDQNYLWLITLFGGSIAGAMAFAKSTRGTFMIHRYMIRIPIIGSLLHKLNIEIFCRVFAVLYSGSGDNISVIRIAAEASGNKYIEHRVKNITIPMMVAQGVDLVKAMEASGVFTSMALARFRSGAETGNVRGAARQMADYYENETSLKLTSTVEMIQTGVAMIITVAILALTIISSELALVSPSSVDMMNN